MASTADKPAQNKPLFADKTGLFANEPNLTANPANEFSSREMFVRMMLSVVIVIILGVAVLYVSKKFLPKSQSTS